jgi:four helix bundle protein
MASFKKFEDMQVWQSARHLNQKIFLLIRGSRLSTDYKLREQMNGSAGSIMDNIAEGFGRAGNKEFIHFLEIALGSTCELQSQLYRARDRDYLEEEGFKELYTIADEIKYKIVSLIRYLKSSSFRGVRYKDV